ncbi:hypothetical protein AC1031_012361 [Aphanomyces cochlioides]|nr:hypothetical protein AC1031_012361 [Aphanomyces cochlioides]
MLLVDHGLTRNNDSIRGKLHELTETFTKARDFLSHTGEGILAATEAHYGSSVHDEYIVEANKIHAHCIKLCKHRDIQFLRTTSEDTGELSIDVLRTSPHEIVGVTTDDSGSVLSAPVYFAGSPPKSGIHSASAKRPHTDVVAVSALKKKLRLEKPKKIPSIGESVLEGMKAQLQAKHELLEYRKKQDALELEMKREEIALKSRSIRHGEVMEEAKLLSSLGYSKEEVMSYVKDELAKFK